MASDVAKFLKDKYLNSLREVESDLSDSIPGEFRDIREMFKDDRIWSSPSPNFISSLYNLNDALAEWRILKKQCKCIEKIFRCCGGPVQRTKVRLSVIKGELNDLISQVGDSSSSLILSHTTFPSGRSTCFEPNNPPNIMGFDEHERKMVNWLSASGERFKAIGIYGMGGSGKTALVKKVLQNQSVSNKFKHIIWACLSDLTCKEEIDIRIVKYLLECLDYDIDSLEGYRNKVSLMEELERKLLGLGNYLVVFDDVWHCNGWFTDFCHKLSESKIKDQNTVGAVIVTSRIKEVAEHVGGKRLIHLNPLDLKKDEFLEKLVRQNMVTTDNRILDVHEIVHHCHGLAQAAKTLPRIVSQPISQ